MVTKGLLHANFITLGSGSNAPTVLLWNTINSAVTLGGVAADLKCGHLNETGAGLGGSSAAAEGC